MQGQKANKNFPVIPHMRQIKPEYSAQWIMSWAEVVGDQNWAKTARTQHPSGHQGNKYLLDVQKVAADLFYSLHHV